MMMRLRAIQWILAMATPSVLHTQTLRVGPEITVSAGLEGRPLVEPHLAIHPANPDHLLAAARITAVADDVKERVQRQQCVVLLSTNGGTTWRRHDFPITECFDPWVAITPDGQAVFTALGKHPALPGPGDELLVFHSADGGRTWDERPVGLGGGHDHETVVVDGSTPVRAGWLYVVSSRDIRADNANLRTTVFVARSRNGGRAFDPPVHLRTSNLYIRAETPVVLSDGTLVVSFVEAARNGSQTTLLLRRRAWVMQSTDGGHTFSLPMFVNEACGPPQTFSLSALVVDTSGGTYRDRMYFACNLPHMRGVVVNHSVDRGESWSEPIVIHAETDSTAARKLMAMATNKDGVLAVAWRDGRHRPGTSCFDVYITASVDGGTTFLAEQRVTGETSCSDPKLNGSGWSDGGDYFGLASDPQGRFRLLWSDARDGVFALRTASVEVSLPGSRER